MIWKRIWCSGERTTKEPKPDPCRRLLFRARRVVSVELRGRIPTATTGMTVLWQCVRKLLSCVSDTAVPAFLYCMDT